MALSDQELKDLQLIQHNMAPEGHTISMDELIEIKKKSKVAGAKERINDVIARAKEEGISDSEAIEKYFFEGKNASGE